MGKPLIKKKVLGEPCIYYSPSGEANSYDILVSRRINGRSIQRTKVNVKYLTEAKKVRNQFIRELENTKEELNHGDIFWSKALEEYLNNLKLMMNTGDLNHSTYESRKTTLEFHTKSWGTKRLSEFSQAFIRLFIFENLNELKPDTKKSILKYIRQVFNYQISIGNKILKMNPASGIAVRKINSRERKGIRKPDMEKILNHTYEIDSDWYSVYLLAFQLGCRSGELYALKWSDVDWDANSIKVSHSYEWRTKEEKTPKNGKTRTLPLNPSTKNFLKEFQNSQKTTEVYILPRISAWQAGRAAQVLAEFQKDLNIPKTNFHAIRSTFISTLLLASVSPVQVMELAGHSDLKVTMLYVRELAKELQGTTDTLDFTPKKMGTVHTMPQKKKTETPA